MLSSHAISKKNENVLSPDRNAITGYASRNVRSALEFCRGGEEPSFPNWTINNVGVPVIPTHCTRPVHCTRSYTIFTTRGFRVRCVWNTRSAPTLWLIRSSRDRDRFTVTDRGGFSAAAACVFSNNTVIRTSAQVGGVTHTVRGLVDDSAKSTEPFRPFWPAKRLGHSVFVRFRRSPIIGRPPEYGSTVVMRYRTLAERRWRRRRYTRYFCRRGVANGFRAKQPKRFTVVFRLILSAIVFRNRPNGVRRRLTTGTIAYTRTCEFVWNKKLKKVKIISEIAFVSFVLCVEVPNTLERVKRALLCLFSQRASTIFKWIIPVP